jgi:hypothetical protein
MNALVSLYRKAIVAGGLALVIPFAGIAADNVPPETLNVKVFPDHYVAAGRVFADAGSLAAWAKPILIRTLWLDTCSPASTKQLLAAVERFQSVYPEGIQIRALPPGEAGCSSAIGSGSDAASSKAATVDTAYLATDESGRGVLP